MKKNHEDRIWVLLVLKLNGEAGFQELQELDALLELYPKLKEQCVIMETLFVVTVARKTMPEPAYKKLLYKIYRVSAEKKLPITKPGLTQMQAMLLCPAVMILGLLLMIWIFIK